MNRWLRNHGLEHPWAAPVSVKSPFVILKSVRIIVWICADYRLESIWDKQILSLFRFLAINGN